jgi:hypothetical protein
MLGVHSTSTPFLLVVGCSSHSSAMGMAASALRPLVLRAQDPTACVGGSPIVHSGLALPAWAQNSAPGLFLAAASSSSHRTLPTGFRGFGGSLACWRSYWGSRMVGALNFYAVGVDQPRLQGAGSPMADPSVEPRPCRSKNSRTLGVVPILVGFPFRWSASPSGTPHCFGVLAPLGRGTSHACLRFPCVRRPCSKQRGSPRLLSGFPFGVHGDPCVLHGAPCLRHGHQCLPCGVPHGVVGCPIPLFSHPHPFHPTPYPFQAASRGRSDLTSLG